MDRSEWMHRAWTLALIVGGLAYFGSQLTPFDLAQRQGISFGLIAALALRFVYLIIRDGWDAAEIAANGEGRFMIVTLVACALITTTY